MGPEEPKTPEEQWADDFEQALRELDPDERRDLSLYLMVMVSSQPWPDQAIDDPVAYLASIDALDDPQAWIDRHREATRAEWQAQLERNRAAAEAARQSALDAETQALLAAAESYLQGHAT